MKVVCFAFVKMCSMAYIYKIRKWLVCCQIKLHTSIFILNDSQLELKSNVCGSYRFVAGKID